ncbi:hypothetical protein AB0F72_19220 [Actinoplanes sp. NPDC023936]|uniref:hypothetical protein n=1 Tax=Actinoplanes sp. NPDC023936 TaxID=3154910 RepID=UPI0033ED0E82
MPQHWRDVLVARDGPARVRADRQSSQSVKLLLLAVFRRQGATITEAIAAFEALVDDGIVGSPAEMTLLAERLKNAGATVSLTPARSAAALPTAER